MTPASLLHPEAFLSPLAIDDAVHRALDEDLGRAGDITSIATIPEATQAHAVMIARQSGAGNLLFNALDMGQYDTVYAMIIIIGAMGIGLDAAFERLRRGLVKWSEPGFDIPLSFA